MFFAYDVVTVKRPQQGRSYLLFAAACLLNTAAAAVLLASQIPGFAWDAIAIIFCVLAAISCALMIWALFFALPKDTYADPQQGRSVCDWGMYALCRHPGVLWYCVMFLCLGIAFRTASATIASTALCAGNIAYMVFQDLWSFPRVFGNYDEYRKHVPFFLPTASSFSRALADVTGGAR